MHARTRLVPVSLDELRENVRPLTTQHEVDEMAVPSYTHPNPLIRWLFWRRLHVALELLHLKPADTVWEFGAGTGVLLPTLAAGAARVVASDLLPEPARRMVERRGLANVEVAEDTVPPEAVLPRGSVDAIVALDVLEHVDDLHGIIRTFAERLAPGGRVIVSGPTETLFYKLGRLLAGFGDKGDYHHTTIDAIRAAFVAAGFRLAEERRLPPAPLPRLFSLFVGVRR